MIVTESGGILFGLTKTLCVSQLLLVSFGLVDIGIT